MRDGPRDGAIITTAEEMWMFGRCQARGPGRLSSGVSTRPLWPERRWGSSSRVDRWQRSMFISTYSCLWLVKWCSPANGLKKAAERTDTSGWSAEMERRDGKQIRWSVNGEKRQFHHKTAWMKPELQNQRKSWCKSSINNNNLNRVSTLCSCLMCSMLDLIRTNSISSFTSSLALIKSLALPFSHPQETELFLIFFQSMESL